MVVDPTSILTVAGITIILGYVSSFIFKKTRIPDVIFLLMFGVLIGPMVLNQVNVDVYIQISLLLSIVTLILLLFDSGLEMDIFEMLKDISRGTLLAILTIGFSTLGTTLLFMIIFPQLGLLKSLLFGIILSGTATEIVLPLLQKMKIKDKIRTVLELETIILDPITIVTVLTLIAVIQSGAVIGSIGSLLLNTYSGPIFLGVVIGIVWLVILDRMKSEELDYILTLGVMLLAYVVVEHLKGSGVMFALVFGLVLGNSRIFSKVLKLQKVIEVDELIKKFQKEITFFIISFFFVYTGIIIKINQFYLFYGIIFSVALILLRISAIKIGTLGMNLSDTETKIAKTLAARGLATALLAQLPLAFGLGDAELILNIAFVVILATVIYTTVFTAIYYKPEKLQQSPAQKIYSKYP